jgi:hypothetical protein
MQLVLAGRLQAELIGRAVEVGGDAGDGLDVHQGMSGGE